MCCQFFSQSVVLFEFTGWQFCLSFRLFILTTLNCQRKRWVTLTNFIYCACLRLVVFLLLIQGKQRCWMLIMILYFGLCVLLFCQVFPLFLSCQYVSSGFWLTQTKFFVSVSENQHLLPLLPRLQLRWAPVPSARLIKYSWLPLVSSELC